MKHFKLVRRFGSVVVGAAVAAPAFAAGSGIDTIFAAVDLTTVATWVVGVGVLVIGIAMAFKGIDLGKRGIKKA
nr:hypothetical protein [uncultured Deefgea sp.]